MGGRPQQALHGGLVERPDHLGRRTDDQRTVGKRLALGDQRAGADQAAAADASAVEQDRAHADQRAGADRAAVQDRPVADRAVFADVEGKAHIGVQRATLLDIAARAEADALVVAAQRRPEPDSAILPERDVADDVRVGRDPEAAGRRQNRANAAKRVNRHLNGLL